VNRPVDGSPARQLPTGTILVEAPPLNGRTVLSARVSSADQKGDLQRQGQRLEAFAQERGWADREVVTEMGSGLNGKRLPRPLRDPMVRRIVVKHRDRLTRFEMLEAALLAAGKRVVVVEEGEVTDDRVQDILAVLTAACGRLYGRRSARKRAQRALAALGCG